VGIDRKDVRSSAQKEVRSGNWHRAIDHYETLVDDDPEDVRSRLKLADLYTRVGDEQRAIDSYREVGDRHAEKDLYQKAVAVYKQAIRLDPEDPELHRKVGEAYHRIDRLKDAAQALRRAQKRYKRRGDRDEQLEILEELIRLDPDDVGLRIQLAETCAKEDRTDEALRRFREAAEILEEEGRLDDYAQVAERIVYFDPEDVEVRKNAIDIYIDRGEHKRALKHLQVCFNNHPDDEKTLRQLAETFTRLDRTGKAALVFKKLAKQYTEQGRAEKAREVWTRVLDVDPSDETAQRALRRLGGDRPEQQRRPSEPERREQPERAGRAASEEEDSEADALEDVEFLDEEPADGAGARKPNPPPGEGTDSERRAGEPSGRAGAGDAAEFADVSTRQIEEPLGGGEDENRSPQLEETSGEGRGGARSASGSNPSDPSTAAETTRTGANPPSVTEEQLEEMLDEAMVFLKYELYDKAGELLQNILRAAPQNLRAYEIRRRLYVELEEPRAEASTLVDMARLCSDRPRRARGYLTEAAELGAPERQLQRAASELGIELDDIRQRAPAPSASEDEHGLEESTAALDEAPISSDEPGPAGSGNPSESDEAIAIDSSEVEVIGDVDRSRGDEGGSVEVSAPGDAIDRVDPTETGPEPDDELEPVADAGGRGGGWGSGHESEPPDDPVDREQGELDSADGLNFSSEELEGAFDGILANRDDEQPQPTDDGVLSEVDELIEAGDYEAAEEALTSVERRYPDHPGIQFRRQTIREAGGPEFQRPATGSRSLSGEFEAEAIDEESVRDEVERDESRHVDAGVEHTSLQLGLSYRDMEMYDEAIEEFQEAIQDPDAAPAAKFHIAVCKAEKGNEEEAANDLARLLRYDQLHGELEDAARAKLEDLESASG